VIEGYVSSIAGFGWTQISGEHASEDAMLARYFRNAIWLAQIFDNVQRFWKLESVAKKNIAKVRYVILILLLSTYFVRGVWNCEQGTT
jgi:hypothetical protein